MFDNIDFKSFWKESEYINKVCTGENLTDEMVQEAEKRPGVKLPPLSALSNPSLIFPSLILITASLPYSMTLAYLSSSSSILYTTFC